MDDPHFEIYADDPASRPFDWRLIIAVAVVQIAAVAVFIWMALT